MRMLDHLHRLAAIDCPSDNAISFFYRPETPESQAHRTETLQIKELVREAMQRAEATGKSSLRKDLERLMEMGEQLRGNGGRSKAIFACAERGLWHEVDVAVPFAKTELHIERNFRLAPLARMVAESESVLVLLIDRAVTRFFSIANGEIKGLTIPLEDDGEEREIRTTGAKGSAQHERQREDEVLRHFRIVARKVEEMLHADTYDRFLIGCREQTYPEFRQCLSDSVDQKLLGHFVVDPGLAQPEEVLAKVQLQLEELRQAECAGVVRDVIGEASRNGLGSLGIEQVLRSLERGEIRELLIGEGFSAPVMECTNCGHLDARGDAKCEACGRANRELRDVTDLLIAKTLAADIALRFVNDDEFRRNGNIGALLRFRADQNTPQKLAS